MMQLHQALPLIWAVLTAGTPIMTTPSVGAIEGSFFSGDGVGQLAIDRDGRFEYSLGSDVGYLEKATGTLEVADGKIRFVVDSRNRLALVPSRR